MDFNLILESLQNDIIFELELALMFLSLSYLVVMLLPRNIKVAVRTSLNSMMNKLGNTMGIKLNNSPSLNSTKFLKQISRVKACGLFTVDADERGGKETLPGCENWISNLTAKFFNDHEGRLSGSPVSGKKLRHLKLIENKFSSSSIYKGIKAKPDYVLSNFHLMNKHLRVGASIPAKRSA